MGGWRKSARGFAAAGLVVLLSQSLTATGATAADPATAQRDLPEQAKLLRPNLVVLKAADLHIQRTSAGRYLRFESGLGNIGRGPIEVRPNTSRPCPTGKHHSTQVIYRDVDGSGSFHRGTDTTLARRSAGCMVFHRAHDHWHFEAASRYTLFQPGRESDVRVTARRKMSFCLRDSRRVPAEYGRFHHAEFYGACSKTSPQGISVGWVDVYQSFLAGQALKLPDRARDGLYCLKIKVDPRNQLLESDDDDNTSIRAFSLRGDAITFRRAGRCA